MLKNKTDRLFLSMLIFVSFFVHCVKNDSDPPENFNSPGVFFTETDGSTMVTEGGATDSYTLALATEPNSGVTITLTPDSQITLAPMTLTFTASDWETPQTVTVTAVEGDGFESLKGATHPGVIEHIIDSSDEGYRGLTLQNITVDITDAPLVAPHSSAANSDCSIDIIFSAINSKLNESSGGYTCASSGCHVSGTTTTGGRYSFTTRAQALGNGSDSEPNVVPGNPWASYLFVKVWGNSTTFPTTSPTRGSDAVDFAKGRMPRNCSGADCIDMDQAAVNLVFCWIAQGARE